MREKFPGWYPRKPDELVKLWDKAIFVPDANVLLHCLRHPAAVRDQLLRLFEVLGDALWIPYQVGLEFHRNRLDVQFGAQDTYDSLIKDQENAFEKARERLRQVRAHPTINVPRELAALDMFMTDFKARMEAARAGHPSLEIDEAVVRLTKILGDRIGDKGKPEQFAALKKEGEDRYAKRIPPGYKDNKKDGGEFDKFGDLIIWKEIMSKAKAENRPIIFISDDAKEDWWWIHRGRKIGPRPELVEEFHTASGQDFHIYEFGQFLRFAAERFPEMKPNVERVEESLLADEEARRRQNDAAKARQVEETLRALEDERDQIVAALSGTPGAPPHGLGDRTSLRGRLDELNREIAAISAEQNNAPNSGHTPPT